MSWSVESVWLRSLITLLCLGLSSPLRSTARIIVVVVVVVVGLKYALSKLLLTPMNIVVKFVAILADRKFLVIVDGNIDTASTNWLILRVVELRDVWVSQSLLGRQSSVRVELK